MTMEVVARTMIAMGVPNATATTRPMMSVEEEDKEGKRGGVLEK